MDKPPGAGEGGRFDKLRGIPSRKQLMLQERASLELGDRWPVLDEEPH